MNTLQSELTKYRTFLASVRHYTPELLNNINQEKVMQQEQTSQGPSRVTANASNRRYKRSSEELDADIAKVDKLVATGKFNQIEALKEVGLQSSVYHYRKRKEKEQPAKSRKPRKFAKRTRKTSYEMKKQKLLEVLADSHKKTFSSPATTELEKELAEIRERYNKLKEYVIENVILHH